MTKAKKAMSIVLAVVMLATMFAFGSLAAGAGNATFEVTTDVAQVEVGGAVTVSVKLTTDYYAGPTSVPIYYDASLFDFDAGSFTSADIFGAGATDVKKFNSNGCLTVAFVPVSAAGAQAQSLNNVTLFTFRLNAKANGVSPVELKLADQKTDSNKGGKLYCGAYANSSVTSEVKTTGQTFTLKNTSVTVGSAAAPELQLADYGAEMGAVIDRTRCIDSGDFTGCVYGVDTINGEDLETYLTTPAGSINIVVNENGVVSTGATIELLDSEGNVVETYVFVYFGDVNGDGSVDISDAGAIEAHDAWVETIEEGTATFLAADVDGTEVVDISDAGAIEAHDAWVESLPSQADIAALFA